jgi:hypothetical protein
LIVDWRFSRIAEMAPCNAFQLCFNVPAELAGVPFNVANLFDIGLTPKPRFPPIWNQDAFLALPFMRPADTVIPDKELAVRLIREGRDVPAESIIFDGPINDGLIDLDEARTFLAALEPVPSVAAQVTGFSRQHFAERDIIGLHVRHGNGGNIMAHTPYWASFDAAINRCVEAVNYARKALGSEAAVFLCTDSSQVHAAIQQRLSDVLTRPKAFRSPGEGELHHGPDAWAGRDDALIEMLLLAECAALIRYPPGSFFSFYAAAILAAGQARLSTTYDLQRPWDVDDDRSPAMILSSQTCAIADEH